MPPSPLDPNRIPYVYVCVCATEKKRKKKDRGKRNGECVCAKRKVCTDVWLSGWVCLWSCKNHLNWERNAGILASDSDRSQISLSEKSPTTRLAISQWLEKEWGEKKKEFGWRDWKREEIEDEKGGREGRNAQRIERWKSGRAVGG